MCYEHSRQYADYKRRPAWVKFLANDEQVRRYRMTHLDGYKREYSESSLETVLECAEKRGSKDSVWFEFGHYQPGVEDQVISAMYSIEVMKRLTCEELAMVLLRNVLEYSLPEMGEIFGVSYGAMWKRWAKTKRRLSEIEAEIDALSAPEPF